MIIDLKQTRTVYSYDDVVVLDGYSELSSRSEVSLSQEISGNIVDIPVAVASMDTVNSVAMAEAALSNRAVYVHHRYCSVEDRLDFSANVEGSTGVLGVAVGLEESAEELRALCEVYDLVSIDVAAANNKLVVEQIKTVMADGIHTHHDNVFDRGLFGVGGTTANRDCQRRQGGHDATGRYDHGCRVQCCGVSVGLRRRGS